MFGYIGPKKIPRPAFEYMPSLSFNNSMPVHQRHERERKCEGRSVEEIPRKGDEAPCYKQINKRRQPMIGGRAKNEYAKEDTTDEWVGSRVLIAGPAVLGFFFFSCCLLLKTS